MARNIAVGSAFLLQLLLRQVVGELGDGCGGSYGALRLLRHRRTGELVVSRWIEYSKGAPQHSGTRGNAPV